MQSEPINVIDPLDQLRPILLPTHEVSWWPLAPGWWVLMVSLLILIILARWLRPMFLARRAVRKRWQNSQILLENLYRECQAQTELPIALQHYLQQSNEIFKRTVRHLTENPSVATLNGDEWVHFLEKVPVTTSDRYDHLYGHQLYARYCTESIRLKDLHRWACAWLTGFKKYHKKFAQPLKVSANVR